jgi:hypothetical protein
MEFIPLVSQSMGKYLGIVSNWKDDAETDPKSEAPNFSKDQKEGVSMGRRSPVGNFQAQYNNRDALTDDQIDIFLNQILTGQYNKYDESRLGPEKGMDETASKIIKSFIIADDALRVQYEIQLKNAGGPRAPKRNWRTKLKRRIWYLEACILRLEEVLKSGRPLLSEIRQMPAVARKRVMVKGVKPPFHFNVGGISKRYTSGGGPKVGRPEDESPVVGNKRPPSEKETPRRKPPPPVYFAGNDDDLEMYRLKIRF